jgi:cell division protein FtsI (penicillin-binding protein 3)
MSAPRIKDAIKFRSNVAFLIMVLVATTIVGRIFWIQIINGAELRRIATQNQVRRIKVKATRGNIYAHDGESLLATSLPYYKVAMDPTVCKPEIFKAKIDSLAMMLSRTFKDRSAADYKAMIVQARRDEDRYMYLNSEYINFQTKKQMTQFPIFNLGKTKGGVIFEKIDKRYYPFQQLALRTVGYLNQDNGGAGLEFSFNKQLTGKNGLSVFQKIAGGNWKPIYEESKPMEGHDIITTLDVNLQDVAQTSLLKHLNLHKADHGCVVMMEVKTGEVRAMANLTLQADGSYRETYNHAIKDKIEPGSTFKLASYMSLLEEGVITPDDSVFCEHGSHQFYDRLMTDSKPEGYGKLSITDAFAKSSNVAISKLIFKHFGKQEQKYIDYLNAFGITENLQFQMRGAERPYIKDPSDNSWSGTTLPWMSVGYELQMTPIQTLALYNAVANGGTMIRPILVKAIREGNRDLETFSTSVLRDKICSDHTLKDIHKMLEAVVDHGTAQNIKNAEYKIAGKTGTAQKLNNGLYTRQYYTSFAGYFPAENPKFSCIVIIDNPKGYQLSGADVAAPVFKELADKVYARDIEMHKELELPQSNNFVAAPVIKAGYLSDLTMLCNELSISNNAANNTEKWVRGASRGKGVRWEAMPIRIRKVPNVRGMMLRDALPILENMGMRVNYSGFGKVISQSINPGSASGKGLAISLTLSN